MGLLVSGPLETFTTLGIVHLSGRFPSMLSAFYQDDQVVLYHGDYREVLPQITALADVVIADPPYGETSLEWDRWPDGWPAALLSHIAPTGSLWCFGSLRMFLNRRDEFEGYRLAQDIVWEKHNGSGFFADRFRRVHELAAHFYPSTSRWSDIYKSPQFTMDATKRTVRKKEKPAQWHGKTGSTTYTSEDGGPRMMRSVIAVRSCHGEAVHPTQKPLGIIDPLIEYSCPPGGLVLSPFAGSGSDLLAAKLSGRRAIGIEARREYCEAAADRLRQGTLFGVTA